MTSYVGIIVYLFNIASWKVWKGTKKVELATMDLSSGRLE